MGNLGRFTISSGHPTMLPGRCATCGTTGDTQYIHFGLHIQFYGEVLICVNCFRGGAIEHCGVVPSHNLETLKADYAVKSRVLDETIAKLKELEDALDNFESMRAYFGSIGTPDVADESQQQAPSQDIDNDGINSESPESAEQRSIESSSEQGSSDIRDNDGADELTDLLSSI